MQSAGAPVGETAPARNPRPETSPDPEPARSPARIQVVVIHHRGREILRRCLESLAAAEGVALDVVLVANGCDEPLPEAASAPGVHVIEPPKALGFSEANNFGVAWGRSRLPEPDAYFFANNDTVVEPDTVMRLAAVLATYPDCAITGPALKIWGATDHLNSLGLNMTWFGEAWDEGIGRPVDEYEPLEGMEPREVAAIGGAALMIRREAFDRLGGWEPLFGFYFEDLDLCLRAWSHGLRVLHQPRAVMYHAISATSEGRQDFKVFLSWRNRFLLLLMHWPTSFLWTRFPVLAAREVAIFIARLRCKAYADARLQARSWWGALWRVPQALWRRRRIGRDRGWTRFLHPHGSVPEIVLPAPEVRGATALEKSLETGLDTGLEAAPEGSNP